MIFVFDLDDTICDTDGYSKDYIANFFAKHNLPYKQINETARFAEKYFDWDMETAKKWYKKYGDEMMLEFPCKNDFDIAVINELHDLGHKIIISTARETDWHINPEQITIKWLKDKNIKYDKLYYGRIDKEVICEIEHADVFVDDDISTVKKVVSHFSSKRKIQVFLMTSKYNKNLEVPLGSTRLSDLSEMYNFIQRKLGK